MESEKLCNRFVYARIKCLAYDKRGKTCTKINHYASQCNSNKKVNSVEDNAHFFVGGIDTLTYNSPSVSRVSHSRPNNWLDDIEINYKIIYFQLDTGTQVNCVNVLCYLWYNKIKRIFLLKKGNSTLLTYRDRSSEITKRVEELLISQRQNNMSVVAGHLIFMQIIR